jgi:hypothetical protein
MLLYAGAVYVAPAVAVDVVAAVELTPKVCWIMPLGPKTVTPLVFPGPMRNGRHNRKERRRWERKIGRGGIIRRGRMIEYWRRRKSKEKCGVSKTNTGEEDEEQEREPRGTLTHYSGAARWWG